jgi:hypothetical protein
MVRAAMRTEFKELFMEVRLVPLIPSFEGFINTLM